MLITEILTDLTRNGNSITKTYNGNSENLIKEYFNTKTVNNTINEIEIFTYHCQF